MKFLCLSCDEGMKLDAAGGPHDGSLQATFVCPRCHYKIAMFTNPWETQLVQTLGVKIGGRTGPSSPYEQVLSNLAVSPPEGPAPSDEKSSTSGCPFAEMFGAAEESDVPQGVRWSEEARGRVDRIPAFVRAMVERAIERYATEQGYSVITEAVMDEARARLGM